MATISNRNGVYYLSEKVSGKWPCRSLHTKDPAIAKASLPLSGMPDLIQKVGGRLHTLHKGGDIACVKVYARGDQQNASAVYYAKSVDVLYDHLDTPLADGE